MNDDDHIRAIRANIDDDGPRLVYADVLLERGDPRGELIVVQCARARLERDGIPGPELRAHIARERELFDLYVKSWVNPFGLRRWWGDFERGFIARLYTSIGGLRNKWDLFGQLPLREVRLRTSARGLAKLGQLAWLGDADTSMRELTLDRNGDQATFDFATLRKILQQTPEANEESSWDKELPHRVLWPALRAITFYTPERAHIHALTAAAGLTLEKFHFNVGTPILAADMRALVASSALREVRDLWAGFVEDEVAIELCRAELPKLRELGLTRTERTPFPPDVGAAFAKAPFLEQLVSLRTDVVLDEVVRHALTSRMPALEALHLDKEPSPDELARLLASPLSSRLRKATFTGANLEPASVVTRTHFERLSELTLNKFWLSADDANALPPLVGFHALNCEYGAGAADAIKARWPYAR